MNLKNIFCKSEIICPFLARFRFTIYSLNKFWVKIINILGYEKRSYLCHIFFAILLKFINSLMTLIGSTGLKKFNKIIMPLPDNLWVLLKTFLCENFSWVSITLICLFPETVITSKCRDSTGSTQAGSS